MRLINEYFVIFHIFTVRYTYSGVILYPVHVIQFVSSVAYDCPLVNISSYGAQYSFLIYEHLYNVILNHKPWPGSDKMLALYVVCVFGS